MKFWVKRLRFPANSLSLMMLRGVSSLNCSYVVCISRLAVLMDFSANYCAIGFGNTCGSLFGLNDVIDFLRMLGPVGIFLASLIGNATPYVGLPYLLVVVEYSALVELSVSELLVISILGGLGSALGKLIILLAGRSLSSFLSIRVRSNLQRFSKLFERSIFSAIFLFAALPLPDDILYVPISFSMYSPCKFFVAVFIGKTLIVGVTAAIGRGLGIAFGGDPIVSGLASFILSILLLLLIAKLNWEKIAIEARELGWLQVMIEFLKSPGKFVR